MVVGVILHLSDLHLLRNGKEQDAVLTALVDAVKQDRLRRGRNVDMIAITGDVFDSAVLDRRRATARFRQLHDAVCEVLGRRVPTVVVPGNHDRRVEGLVGPHRRALFEALAESVDETVYVHGADSPFLSAVVPQDLHGQPFWVIAYDSTYLPRGLIGAGGMIRQEDLLHAAALIGDEHPDWPVVLLVHHHLVSTPITDYDHIETRGRPMLFRWGVTELLPRLVANADREEWMMTALGAGTALSTLHTLGRAVLVLHGHKHNATARCLDATVHGQGDVMIASAGSAGTAQSVDPEPSRRSARIWPSFNVVELDDDALSIEAVSFGWKGRSRGELEHQPLVWAARRESQWVVEPMGIAIRRTGPRLKSNEARFSLVPSTSPACWDLSCQRQIVPDLDARLPHYTETIHAPEDAIIELADGTRVKAPHELCLEHFEVVRYRLTRALPRTFDEARRRDGDGAPPYGSVELLNRYTSEHARLALDAPAGILDGAFASAVDVGTGLERPLKLEHEGAQAIARLDWCPARTMLRVYWPLEGATRRRPRRRRSRPRRASEGLKADHAKPDQTPEPAPSPELHGDDVDARSSL